MKRNLQIFVIQAILILLISALVSYTLVPLLETNTPPDEQVKYYVVYIAFVVLSIVGFITAYFPGIGPLPFGLITFFTAVPAILGFNLLDLGVVKTYVKSEFMGIEILRPEVVLKEISPVFQFEVMLAVGLFIIAGYFALSYLNALQIDYRKILSGEAEKSEIEIITGRNIRVLFIFLAASIVLTVVSTVILRMVQTPATEYLNNYPWAVLVFGLAAILFLAGFLYWTGTIKRKKS